MNEWILIIVPIIISIIISFMITLCFRFWDKKDLNEKNLRSELREYFLTNCKPIINEIIIDQDQKFRKYVYLLDREGNHIEITTLQKYFQNHHTLIFKLPLKFAPLIYFVTNISHKKYIIRFESYLHLLNHIITLYNKLIYPQIMNPNGQKESLKKIASLIIQIDFILVEAELVLFNYNFDKDDTIFQQYIYALDKAVLETGLDSNNKFSFNKEGLKKVIDEILKEKNI